MAGDYDDHPGPQGPPAGSPPSGTPQIRRPRQERELLTAPARRKVSIGRRIVTIGAGALFGLLLFPLLYPVVDRLEAGGSGPNSTVAGGAAGATESTDTGPTTTSLKPLEPPDAGPHLLASLDQGSLTLDGMVPSQEVADDLTSTAELTYGSRVTSAVTVDGGAPADWLATVPDVLSLLARATKGWMLVVDGQVTLSIQVPSQSAADDLRSNIERATGLPVVVDGLEVTGLEPPELAVQGRGGQISLTGRVPSQEIWTAVGSSATAAYGGFNVTNQLTVDENVHTALWMFDPTTLFTALDVFPELDIQILGETVTGYFRGGYSFDRGAENAIPENDVVTGFIVDLMARDPSLQMYITAHTDSDGEEASNMALSEQRASYVYELFRGAGVDESRMESAGKGESEPVDTADTDEAKARNRRIEVQLSTMGGS